jgi:hypothetical protein
MKRHGWGMLAAVLAVFLGLSLWLPLPATLAPTFPGPADGVASISQSHGVSPTWTATRDRSAAENAAAHFRKHGNDVGAVSVDDYIAKATAFLRAPPPGTQTARQPDGDTMRFRAATGEFAVMRRDGTPRTYFILDPAIHGYASNQAYFDAQQNPR